MRFINTRVHGLLDYIVSIILISSPWLFGFYDNGPESTVPIALGVITIVYSLLTRYEFGLMPLIPMPSHLVLDFLNGLFLATSPWLLGFADNVWLPHVIMGVFEITASLISKKRPTLITHA